MARLAPLPLALMVAWFAGCAPAGTESRHRATSKAGVERYYATFTAPCGRSILELRRTPESAPILAQPSGEGSPVRKLSYDMLIRGKFIVYGELREHDVVDDHHCGAYPRVVIDRFEPWGPVQRCTSFGSLDMERYTQDLPTDRYVAEDFEDGPVGRLLRTDDCQHVPKSGGCPDGLVYQVGCDGTEGCCPLVE